MKLQQCSDKFNVIFKIILLKKMSRAQYVSKHPDLKHYTQLMHPSIAKRMGLKNVHTMFPRSFDPSSHSTTLTYVHAFLVA